MEILLSQSSINMLTLVILAVTITVYLFGIKNKAASTWLLGIFFTIMVLISVWAFLTVSVAQTNYWRYFFCLQYTTFFFALIPLLQFPYSYGATDSSSQPSISNPMENTTVLKSISLPTYFRTLSPTYQREAKIVLAISSLIALLALGWMYQAIYPLASPILPGNDVTFISLVMGLELVCCLTVMVRRTLVLSTTASNQRWYQQFMSATGKPALAMRAFTFVFTVPLGIILLIILSELEIISVQLFVVSWSIVRLIFFFIFIVVYLNYAREPSTFMVKLLGTPLVTMLLVLGLVGLFIEPFYTQQYHPSNPWLQEQTLQFTPLIGGGYTIQSLPFQFDEQLGTKLEVTQDTPHVAPLAFVFPFYNRRWSNLYINENGAVSFNQGYNRRDLRFESLAMITPLLLDLDTTAGVAETGVFFKDDDHRATITWSQIPQQGTSASTTMQLVLDEAGIITMTYKMVNAPALFNNEPLPAPWLSGILTGQAGLTVDNHPLATDQPFQTVAPGGLVYNYFLDFRHYLHQGMLPLAYIIIITSLFILFGYPIFFRINLIKPLNALVEGVREVNKGNLDVNVPVQYNDEFGFLTDSFNYMVQSVKQTDTLKDEFLANTSHELRTPLNGIIGLAESMLNGGIGPLSKTQNYNLQMIVYSGQRLANMVNDILDFSKLKHHELTLYAKPVDLYALSEVVLTLSQPLVGQKPLTLINDIHPDLPFVLADENRLQQIMHNLIGNAIKFNEAGEVRLKAEVVAGNPSPSSSQSPEGDENAAEPATIVKVTVSDTGIGIPSEKLSDIFSPFIQADSSAMRVYGGTGLGLTVTKQLVNLHGGAITVESTPGQGSHFSFTLPLSETTATLEPVRESNPYQMVKQRLVGHIQAGVQDQSPTQLVTTTKPTTRENSHQILVVDDEPINLQVINNYLTPENYHVVQASSGPEALALIEAGLNPDLVILDVMMPRMTGFDVCQQIRRTFPANEMPILMLTAKNQVTDLVQGFKSGANDYLTKPISKDELLTRVQTHLDLAQINLAYSRFVPRQILQFLNKQSIVDVRLGDQTQCEMTILFSDVRGFTSLSEQMTPKENFDFINTFLSGIGPIVRQHNGFIDKYIGDAVMALFPHRADDGVNAAIAMRQWLADYNQTRAKTHLPPLLIGIGLHTGSLMLGTIGEAERMEGTVISDAVNTASRLEGLTKAYRVNILVSKATLNQLESQEIYTCRFVDTVQVKGKQGAIKVYEIFDDDPQAIRTLKVETKAIFEAGASAYAQGDFVATCTSMEEVLAKNPDDGLAQLYLERARDAQTQGLAEDWRGITKMDKK